MNRFVLLVFAFGCAGDGGCNGKDRDSGDATGTGDNDPPVVTIDTPSEGASLLSTEPFEISGFVADDNDAPGDLSVRLEVEGAVVDLDAPAADGSFFATTTTQDGDYTLTVIATDLDGASGSDDVRITVRAPVGDQPPSTPEVHVEPGAPVTGEALVVVIDVPAEDPEGAVVEHLIAWTRDGTPWAGESVPAGETARGEVWAVAVVGSDGTQAGESAVVEVTIANAPPTAAGAVIGPEGATVADTLTCTVLDAADVEGDPLTFAWAWTVGGVSVGDGSGTLPPGSARDGEDITCTVTISDGQDTTDVVAPLFQIGNTAPGAPEVAISPAEPTDTDDLTCTIAVAATDIDGDALTYAYAWSVDGVASAFTTDTIAAGDTHRDEVWACEVVAVDEGGLTSAPATASVVILPGWSGGATAEDASIVITASVAEGAFGKTVALLGDMDGDSLSELLVGASGESLEAGAVYLFSGASLVGSVDASVAVAGWALSDEGAKLGGYRSMTQAGDLDGDGAVDVLFGAADYDGNGEDAGEAWLWYGDSGWSLGMDPTDGDWAVEGSANDQLGARMAVGDIDGDGVAEVILSAPGASDGERLSGTVAVFGGTTTRRSGVADFDDADYTIYGEDIQDGLGWTLKVVGDVNDDGFEELFCSAIYADQGGTNAGASALRFGEASLSGSDSLAGAADALFVGDAAYDRFGYDVQGGVDLDQDGIGDLVVGEYQDDTVGEDAGAVRIFYGRSRWASDYAPTDADVSILGTAAGDLFGHVFAAPGDLDGEGTVDLVVGALFSDVGGLSNQGAAWVVLPQDHAVASASDLTWWRAGEAVDDLFGDALSAGQADIDGDGVMDFAVGAQGSDAGGTDAGRVYVWRGER